MILLALVIMQAPLSPVVDFAWMRDLLASDPRLSLSQKLREKREDTGLTQEEIGRIVRPPMKQATVSTYERDPEKLIPRGIEFSISFFRAYGFNEYEAIELARQLFSGVTELLRRRSEEGLSVVGGGSTINIYAAGTGPAWGDVEVLEQVFLPGIGPGQYIGLKATGDSMVPYLRKGDVAIVLCDDGAVAPGDMCAVWLADDGCVVKRFVVEHPDGTLLLESMNPQDPSKRYFTAPLGSRVIGKVIRRLLHD